MIGAQPRHRRHDTMTPKATELLDKALTTHAAKVCADPSDPAKSLILAGDANAAHAKLCAYIESLERIHVRGKRAKQGEIPDAVEAFLKEKGEGAITGSIMEHLRRRGWIHLTGANLGNFLRLLEGEGRVARVCRGKWRAATPPTPSAPPSLT